jgi:hypothetical protein
MAKQEEGHYELNKRLQALHVVVSLREISLIEPKQCDGDLFLLVELKDYLSCLCVTTVSLQCHINTTGKLSNVLTINKYVGCFRDTVSLSQIHLHNYSTKNFLNFNHFTLSHHVSCVQNWLIWFYAVLLLFGSLMAIPC